MRFLSGIAEPAEALLELAAGTRTEKATTIGHHFSCGHWKPPGVNIQQLGIRLTIRTGVKP
jgi:hypothetical protein